MSTRVLPDDDSDGSVEGRLQRPEPGVREDENAQASYAGAGGMKRAESSRS